MADVSWEDPLSTRVDNVAWATLGRNPPGRCPNGWTVINSLSSAPSFPDHPLRTPLARSEGPHPAEIGRVPHRDRSSSGARSVQFRTEIGSERRSRRTDPVPGSSAAPIRPRPRTNRLAEWAERSGPAPPTRPSSRAPRRVDEHRSIRARSAGGLDRPAGRRVRHRPDRDHDLPARSPVLGHLRVPHDGHIPHGHVPHGRRHRAARDHR